MTMIMMTMMMIMMIRKACPDEPADWEHYTPVKTCKKGAQPPAVALLPFYKTIRLRRMHIPVDIKTEKIKTPVHHGGDLLQRL